MLQVYVFKNLDSPIMHCPERSVLLLKNTLVYEQLFVISGVNNPVTNWFNKVSSVLYIYKKKICNNPRNPTLLKQ